MIVNGKVLKLKIVSLMLVFVLALLPMQSVKGADNDNSNIQSFNLDLNDDQIDDYTIIFHNPGSSVVYKPEAVATKNYRYMERKKYRYIQYYKNAKSGYLDIVINKFPTKDHMFFVDYYSNTDNLPLNYEIKANNMGGSFSMRTAKVASNACEISPDKTEGIKSLSNVVRYVDSPQRYLKFSKVIKARNMGYSVYDVDDGAPRCNLLQSEDSLTFQYSLLSSKNMVVKSSWLLSVNPLVNWKHDLAYRSLLNMDIKNDNYYFFDGVYRVNMSNYVPRSKPGKSYFENPSGLQVRACKWVLGQGNLFKDMGIYTMYSYADSYNDKGYIPTQPKSEWLSKDFGIGYNFYDTRFNSDTINSLIPFYYNYPDDYVLEKIKGYIKFYKGYYKAKQFKAGNAVFVPDYMDYSGKNKINHSSLNHFIAQAQALYEFYELTGDLESLDIARKMVKSIQATSSKWIKKDGDLWYKITPDGKYATNDYPLVTYNDLVNFNSMLARVEKAVPAEIAKLLESKMQWAIKKGYIK